MEVNIKYDFYFYEYTFCQNTVHQYRQRDRRSHFTQQAFNHVNLYLYCQKAMQIEAKDRFKKFGRIH